MISFKSGFTEYFILIISINAIQHKKVNFDLCTPGSDLELAIFTEGRGFVLWCDLCREKWKKNKPIPWNCFPWQRFFTQWFSLGSNPAPWKIIGSRGSKQIQKYIHSNWQYRPKSGQGGVCIPQQDAQCPLETPGQRKWQLLQRLQISPLFISTHLRVFRVK